MKSNEPHLVILDSNQPRRIFLQRALTAAGLTLSAGAISAILTSCETDESQPTPPVNPTGIKIKVSDYKGLTGPGSIITTTIEGLDFGVQVFISQVSATDFAVFSTTCPHDGCPVALPTSLGADCVCTCHSSRFSSSSGALIPTQAPATSSLRAFASTFDAATGILTIQP